MNEPAFPTIDANTNAGDYGTPGMTLRDYFAAKALTGLIVADSRERYTAEVIAKSAYELADAMLKERDRITLEKEST